MKINDQSNVCDKINIKIKAARWVAYALRIQHSNSTVLPISPSSTSSSQLRARSGIADKGREQVQESEMEEGPHPQIRQISQVNQLHSETNSYSYSWDKALGKAWGMVEGEGGEQVQELEMVEGPHPQIHQKN
mmetsp:Transcript_12321/g.24831  ORF Transcript_12321/g.24831 Transcript_12321/m.24831 type:complete len:133 (-) Transcript_12321:111-509(-)